MSTEQTPESQLQQLYPDLDLTPAEISLFLTRAAKANLDALSGQIVPQIRKSKDPRTDKWIRKLTIVTTIDALRLIADRTHCYSPGRDTEFVGTDIKYTEAPEYARVFVKKFAGETWHEYSGQAYFSEYVQLTRDGKVTGMWARMPRNQLAKCAEAQALRRGFPLELGGLYVFEELEQAERARVPKVKKPEPEPEPDPDKPTAEQRREIAKKLVEFRELVGKDKLQTALLHFMGLTDLKDAITVQWVSALDALDDHLAKGDLKDYVEALQQ